MKKFVLFDSLGVHFHKNIWLYMFSLLFLCTGIVLGTYTIKYMGNVDKNVLSEYIKGFSKGSGINNVSTETIFLQTIKDNLPVIIGLWFLGLTIIGIPFVLIVDLVKGFTFGFSLSFIINDLGYKGIYFILLELIPQNIIYIPCIIISSVIAMEFSLRIIKDKIDKRASLGIGIMATQYSISFLFILIFMFLGFIIESFASPRLLKLVASIYQVAKI